MNPQKTQVHLAKELTLNQLLGTISPILYESIDFVGQKSLTNFPLSIQLVIISNHFPFLWKQLGGLPLLPHKRILMYGNFNESIDLMINMVTYIFIMYVIIKCHNYS